MHVSPFNIKSRIKFILYIIGLLNPSLNLTFDVACTEAWTTRGVKCLLNGNDARIVTKYSGFQETNTVACFMTVRIENGIAK